MKLNIDGNIIPLKINEEIIDGGIKRETETISVPQYNPNCGMSEAEYYKRCFDGFDEEQLNTMGNIYFSVNRARTPDERYILPEDDLPEYQDESWKYDVDDCVSEGEVHINPNEEKSEMSEKLTSQNQNMTNMSYWDHKREEAQRLSEEAWHHQQVVNGTMLEQIASSLNGRVDDLGKIIDTAATANTNEQLKRVFNRNRKTNNGVSISPEFEIKNGKIVRKFTPTFTIRTDGNKYRSAFAYFANTPFDPRYEQFKELFIKEEMAYVNSMKTFYRYSHTKPVNVSDEDWEIEIDRAVNPYTEYGPDAPKMEEPEDFMSKPWCTPTKLKAKVRLKITKPDGRVEYSDPYVYEEEFVLNGKFVEEDTAYKRRINHIINYDVHAAYLKNYNEFAAKKKAILDKKCPGWDTASAGEWSVLDIMNFWDVAVNKPYEKCQRYREKQKLPVCPDFDTYTRNIGLEMMHNLQTNNTEGDIVIRKMGLKPGMDLYDECISKKEKEAKWVSEVFNSDGSMNMDVIREKYPFWDAMVEAHELAIKYGNTKHSTIAKCGANIDLPLSVEASLSDDVKTELGLMAEAPDYEFMKEYAKKNGKTIAEAFVLKDSPFRDCFDKDGNLKEGGFGSKHRVYPSAKKKDKDELDATKYPCDTRDITEIPEEARKFYTYDPIFKIWENRKAIENLYK